MATKIRAGRYTTTVKSGSYTIKNVRSKVWLVLNDHHRKVAQFETLSAAENWLDTLTDRPASEKSKKYLRDLLAAQSGSELAGQIRSYFNDKRAKGLLINQGEVSLAIKRLTAPVAWSQVPVQRQEVVMSRGEAIATARKAIADARV